MISLDDLNRYQDILKEIEQLSADISTVVTSLATTGRPSVGGHGSTPGDPTAHKAIRITDLKQQRHELYTEADRILNAARMIPDEKVRACCLCHYIYGLSWKQTSIAVCDSEHREAAYGLVNRYFTSIHA